MMGEEGAGVGMGRAEGKWGMERVESWLEKQGEGEGGRVEEGEWGVK